MIRFRQIEAKLDEAIKNSGMTEREIAKKLGLRRYNTLSVVIMYSLEKFSNVCRILNLDANEIMCIKEYKENIKHNDGIDEKSN
ncbi:MAG: hypothetical protein K2O08_04280 [Clostridia bacterium]|nr:hypothetical protein [Clostridia bacterium]